MGFLVSGINEEAHILFLLLIRTGQHPGGVGQAPCAHVIKLTFHSIVDRDLIQEVCGSSRILTD